MSSSVGWVKGEVADPASVATLESNVPLLTPACTPGILAMPVTRVVDSYQQYLVVDGGSTAGEDS